MTIAADMPLPSGLQPAAGPTAIVCRGLVKSFPVRRTWSQAIRRPFHTEWQLVTDHLTCDVVQGELFGLLGPNGAGKTTLMRMLATTVLPDKGTATVHGADVVRDARAVRGMIASVVANERALLWRISASDNLRYFAALLGLRGAARTARINEVLELVEMTDTGHKMVGEFSSGMRQRLLIARALLGTPRVLLLDEPTRSLDPVSARQFRRFMTRLVREQARCTVLLATHSTDEAMELCDRIGVLDRGRLLAVGRPSDFSADLTRDTFRAWLTGDVMPALRQLIERGVLSDATELPGRDGAWREFSLVVPGGHESAAEVVRALVQSNVDVARIERIPVSVADIIERVLAQQPARVARV
ncbi:MAG TPA: ABC transporter ATP-binding protein [Gemmatimonadaceae bacterium]|nr:ABC transporter ATP-binding protein [Gemmatimonadaceae bacterium]